jgi:hypothetical protein
MIYQFRGGGNAQEAGQDGFQDGEKIAAFFGHAQEEPACRGIADERGELEQHLAADFGTGFGGVVVPFVPGADLFAEAFEQRKFGGRGDGFGA